MAVHSQVTKALCPRWGSCPWLSSHPVAVIMCSWVRTDPLHWRETVARAAGTPVLRKNKTVAITSGHAFNRYLLMRSCLLCCRIHKVRPSAQHTVQWKFSAELYVRGTQGDTGLAGTSEYIPVSLDLRERLALASQPERDG